MPSNNHLENTAFIKAHDGLWSSLQKHLAKLYDAEKGFKISVSFIDTFPFSPAQVDYETLAEYNKQREKLRTLFIDEVEQLGTLTQAIRTKPYATDDKKQLYMLLLGYMHVMETVCPIILEYVPAKLPQDEELTEAQNRFERLKKFCLLQIRGIAGIAHFI